MNGPVSQHQLLDGIKADGTQLDGVRDSGCHDGLRKQLHQPQHLDILPLAPAPHPGLQQAAQMSERLGQVPVLQRCRLIQSARLLLDQRQIMQGIKHEVGMPV